MLGRAKYYFEVCKPRVVVLMLFTALVGMLMAAPLTLSFSTMIAAMTGIALVSAAAAAINHATDRKIDALMQRTKDRPLPSGALSTREVLIFAITIGIIGTVILMFWVNMLTAVLTLLSLVGYAVVYTRFLKYATPQNIVIGGAAGATPPMLGWVAATGQLDFGAFLLFLIIFVWTPPHFWALAMYRKEEYAAAGVPMLPVTHGEDFTRLQILLYIVLLTLVTMLPYATALSGSIYLFSAILLNAVFIYYGIILRYRRGPKYAMETFGFSVVYLMLLFAALLVDRYISLLI
ncbi:MAG: protoheme IX farnesyltransferase [Chromatiales bacterium]|nr:protoheme IX farnesyltransferase [Chromatiales bacterium]